MKKLVLKAQQLGAYELLGREEMKRITGGSNPGGSGSDGCGGSGFLCCNAFCGAAYPGTCNPSCPTCTAEPGTGGSVCMP